MPPKKPAIKSAKKGAETPARGKAKKSAGFSDEERAAMRERAKEAKAERRGGKGNEEAAVVAKLATFPQPDRGLGEKIHAIVRASAPALSPKLWYGMPAYARNGKVVCFFQNASKFKYRYSTLGFLDQANLDDGPLWATTFAVKEITPAVEAKIAGLVKKAVS
jgi:uncharacterized protein YdhG (YjbR/CyaY superfamily)